MTTKRRKAHAAMIKGIVDIVSNDFLSPRERSALIAEFVAERLSDVTEEMVERGNVLVSHGYCDLDNTFLAMLRASALFPGDPT